MNLTRKGVLFDSKFSGSWPISEEECQLLNRNHKDVPLSLILSTGFHESLKVDGIEEKRNRIGIQNNCSL